MKRQAEIVSVLVACTGLAVLILDSKTALQGALDGIILCIGTLIPSLFPFIFLSNLLSASVAGGRLRLLRPIGRLCRMPQEAEYIFITGLLGGYPTGAQCIADALCRGVLSKRDARRLLCFCNNCGPAFLFGISAAIFPQWWAPWLLMSIHILSAVLVGIIVPGRPDSCVNSVKKATSPVQALNQAIRSMAGVCGWVVIFRVLLAFGERWFFWYLPLELQTMLTGFLELSNGCVGLSRIGNHGLRFILCSGFLGFGGLCVFMQTRHGAADVDTSLYFPGKVLQCCISMIMAAAIFEWRYGIIPACIGVLTCLYLRKKEKKCRNLQSLDV